MCPVPNFIHLYMYILALPLEFITDFNCAGLADSI